MRPGGIQLAGRMLAAGGNLCNRHRLILFPRRPELIARHRKTHGPHPGVKPFGNARRGIVYLHAAADRIDTQRNHVLQRHPRPRTPARREIVGGDPAIRRVAVLGGGRHKAFHYRTRVAGAGANLDTGVTQCRNRVDNPGDRCGKIDNFGNLQRHKGGINLIDIRRVHGTAKLRLPAGIDGRKFAQRFNMLPLAKPHRHACFGKRYLHAKRATKSLDKNLRRCERAKIDGGTRPIENNSVNAVHDGSLFCPVHRIANGGQQGGDIGVVHLANVADTEAVAL